MFFEKFPEYIIYQNSREVSEIGEMYFLARYESNEAPETIIHYVDFLIKLVLKEINRDAKCPYNSKDKASLFVYYENHINEAIKDASNSSKSILINKKYECDYILREAISKNNEKWSKIFSTRIALADKMAYLFFAQGENSVKYGEKIGVDAVDEYYMEAFYATNSDTKDYVEFILHISDFYSKISLMEAKKLNRPYTIDEFLEYLRKEKGAVYLRMGIDECTNENKDILNNKIDELALMLQNELIQSKSKEGGCYIATAIYGSYECPQLLILRYYRDNTLSKSFLGKVFISSYYAVSPHLVKWFGKTKWFIYFGRRILDLFIAKLQENT